MKRQLYTQEQVARFITEGRMMVLSADEQILMALPRGNWVGGTTPYFMDTTMGQMTKDAIFVDDLTDTGTAFKIMRYDKKSMVNIGNDSFVNGFTVLILPFDAPAYYEFANHSLSYPGIFQNPVVGFVAGFDFADFGKVKAKVINGETGEVSTDDAVALHVQLPEGRIARSEILNLDVIDPLSPTIIFPRTSFTQSSCMIDGKEANIAEYFHAIGQIPGAARPLITNTNGALINRDIKEINMTDKTVSFFSPAYEGDVYRIAVGNDQYLNAFNDWFDSRSMKPVYVSMCISYYFIGKFEGKKINMTGAFAFGEISFQLLNKTLVFLEIETVV